MRPYCVVHSTVDQAALNYKQTGVLYWNGHPKPLALQNYRIFELPFQENYKSQRHEILQSYCTHLLLSDGHVPAILVTATAILEGSSFGETGLYERKISFKQWNMTMYHMPSMISSNLANVDQSTWQPRSDKNGSRTSQMHANVLSGPENDFTTIVDLNRSECRQDRRT